MKTLQAQVPEWLLREVQELAEKQNATVDQIVSVALAGQVGAPSRAARVNSNKDGSRPVPAARWSSRFIVLPSSCYLSFPPHREHDES